LTVGAIPASPTRRALVLSDGAAGNENQALALASLLAPAVEALRLESRAPWRWSAPRRLPGAARAFGPAFAARLRAPWPELVVGCGRQAALATRLLRAASGGTCRSVQILDPRIDARHFDLVVAPAHDGLRGENVITTRGGLNPIDDAWLAQARDRFTAFARLPAPRLVLLIGGPTRALALDEAYWRALAAALGTQLAQAGGSLLVTSSRRTPAWLRDAARRDLAPLTAHQWHGPDDGENPYAGFLAWADAIVVTPDSVNMLSEAAATRAPVFTFAPRPPRGKVGRFVESLRQSGRVRALGDDFDPGAITPLREAARVAAEIRTRFGWDGDAHRG
jgi:mitochondrial fission protein ELM1